MVEEVGGAGSLSPARWDESLCGAERWRARVGSGDKGFVSAADEILQIGSSRCLSAKICSSLYTGFRSVQI